MVYQFTSQRIIIVIFSIFCWACGNKSEPIERTSIGGQEITGSTTDGSGNGSGGDDSQDGNDSSGASNVQADCGTGEECFASLIEPDLIDNCMICHENETVDGITISSTSLGGYRLILLSYIGDDRDRLDEKLRGEGVTEDTQIQHANGPIAEPSKEDIDTWLDAEGI